MSLRVDSNRPAADWSRLAGLIALILLLSALAGPADASCPDAGKADLLINDVTVVNVRDGTLESARDVAISAGFICAISPTGNAVASAQRIDGRGRYLVPGLMEMHGHVADRDAMTLYLANGVTTVRNLWGDHWTLDLRRALESEPERYPTLITAGPIIDGAPPVNYPFIVLTDPRDADAEVARQAAAGYDFVKVYSNMSPAVFEAVLAAGRKYGMEVSGHLPHDVPLPVALDGGMRTMEHFLEVADELLRYPPGSDLDLYVVYPDVQERIEAIGRGDIALEDLIDRARIPALAQHAAQSDSLFVPTLLPMRNFTSQWNRPNDEWQRYVSPAIKAYWQRAWAARERWSKAARRGEDQLFALRMDILKTMHDAGAKVLAGTDSPVPGMYFGFSLVDELEQLQQAGLSAAEALHAATLKGARYLNREHRLGEIVVGADADLLLVDDNPLEDLQHLRAIAGVVKAGRWHSVEALQQRTESIATRYAQQEALFADAPGFDEAAGHQVEEVRSTAVKVQGEAADFVLNDTAGVMRMLSSSGDGGLQVDFAVREPMQSWSEYRLLADDSSIALFRAKELVWELQKSGGGWSLAQGGDEATVIGGDADLLPLTGTPVDILLLRHIAVERSTGIKSTGNQTPASEGPIYVLHCPLTRGCESAAGPGFWSNSGFETVNAVFAGAQRVVLTARGTPQTTVWYGAGPYYAGEPIRLRTAGDQRWERLR